MVFILQLTIPVRVQMDNKAGCYTRWAFPTTNYHVSMQCQHIQLQTSKMVIVKTLSTEVY